MQDLIKLQSVIEDVLTDDKRARNCDNYLYMVVCKRIHPEISSMPFAIAFAMESIPKYDSVTRIRRKLQKQNPDLMSDSQIKKFRKEREEIFEEFSRS